MTERIQAAYVTRLYLTAMRLGVEAVCTMFVWDSDNFNGGFFGDVSSPEGATWREKAHAVRQLIGVLPKPKITGAISDGLTGYYAYTVDPDIDSEGDDVIVAWNVEGALTVDSPCAGGRYTVIDMLGSSADAVCLSDSLSVVIGPSPVYIVKAD